MTLTEIIENANSNSEFSPGMSSNELFYGSLTNERLTDVIADVAEACQGKADADHAHDGYSPASHTHDSYAPANHSHEGFAPADHSHNYAASNHEHEQNDISGLENALDGKADLEDGTVPPTQLPLDVYNVYYGYMDDGGGFRDGIAGVRLVPRTDTLYVDTNTGKIYYYNDGYKEAIVNAAQKAAWDSKAAGDHGHSYNDLSDKPTIPTIPDSLPANGGNADTVDGKHASDFAPASHSHNGNIIVEQDASPYMRLKLAAGSREARVYKNASETADYGLTLADYDADGVKDSLIFCRANALDKKLYLNIQNADDSRSLYYLYGEHHKPTPAEIGAVPNSGGTIDGDVDVEGVLRVKGAQAIFDNGTRQTFGSGNREHYATGTTLYCNQSWTVASDERLKENVEAVDKNECASFIDAIQVKTFNYIGADAPCMGVIAQEVQAEELAKFFVSEDKDGYMGVKAADLVFPLIAAVQALSKRVAELEAK